MTGTAKFSDTCASFQAEISDRICTPFALTLQLVQMGFAIASNRMSSRTLKINIILRINAANFRKDEAIVIATSIGSLSCLIAREVHHRRHCFREYTRLLEAEDPGDDPQRIGGQAPSEKQAVAQFLEVVRQELFDKSALLTSADLQSKSQTCCNKESGNFCTQVRNRKLKSTVLQEFDGVVKFVRPARCNAPEWLYAVSSTDNLIRQFALLKEEVAEDEPLVPANYYCSECEDESEDESADVESSHVWTNECEEWRVL